MSDAEPSPRLDSEDGASPPVSHNPALGASPERVVSAGMRAGPSLRDRFPLRASMPSEARGAARRAGWRGRPLPAWAVGAVALERAHRQGEVQRSRAESLGVWRPGAWTADLEERRAARAAVKSDPVARALIAEL